MTLPEFLDNPHIKVERLATVRTGRLYPEKISHSCQRLSSSEDHSATEMFKLFKSVKNLTDLIGNRTRVLLACSAMSEPAVPLQTPYYKLKRNLFPDECDLPLGCSYRDRDRGEGHDKGILHVLRWLL